MRLAAEKRGKRTHCIDWPWEKKNIIIICNFGWKLKVATAINITFGWCPWDHVWLHQWYAFFTFIHGLTFVLDGIKIEKKKKNILQQLAIMAREVNKHKKPVLMKSIQKVFNASISHTMKNYCNATELPLWIFLFYALKKIKMLLKINLCAHRETLFLQLLIHQV